MPSLQPIFGPQSFAGHCGRKFSLEWAVLGKQFLSPLPATATIPVLAAAQRAGLHMQDGKADLHYGQGRAGQDRAGQLASEQVPPQEDKQNKGAGNATKENTTWL